MLTWEDIGCGYGEALTVETIDGKEYIGMLVDFEWDIDNDRGEDCITLKVEDPHLPYLSFYESDIAKMTPVEGVPARWERPVEEIAHEMAAMLSTMRDGTEISASSLASLATGKPLSFLEENLDLSDLLRRFAAEVKALGLALDFSEWDGMAVGLPYNIPFVVRVTPLR